MSPKRDALPLTIDGTTYDVSAWVNHHPGGAQIIENYRNRDATDVFMVMHSQQALNKLKRMPVMEPSSPLTPKSPSDDISEDFRKLRNSMVEKGMFNASPLFYVYKSLTTVALGAVGVLMVMYLQWYYVSAMFLGLCYQQLGWVAHDYAHHQVFTNRDYGNLGGLFFGNVLQGYSLTWWKDRHNGHHAATNVQGHDPDIDNLPVLAWSPEDVKNAGPGTRNIIKYQQYYFLPTIAILRFIWCFQSILGVMSYKTDSKNLYYKRQYRREAAGLALHWILKSVFLFCYMPSFLTGLAFFLISECLGGFGIAIVVFLNHYPLDKVEESVWDGHGFCAGQILTTMNIQRGLITDWFFGGLNYQIEHHLWPNLPRHHLKAVSFEVEKLCQKHNLPYRAPPMHTGVAQLLGYLGKIAQLAAVPV
jgi:fatty acid desaturase